MQKLISLVVPVYNEEKNLHLFYHALQLELEKLPPYLFEIIFVDDGSRDTSWNIIQTLHRTDSRIRGFKLSRNFGHQIALSAGYAQAQGHAIISMDADLQDPPSLIHDFLIHWEQGSLVVYARRVNRKDPFLKKVTARLFYALLKRISPLDIPQSVGDFRLIDRSVLTILVQLKEQTKFLRGLVAWCGFKHTFVDFKRPARVHGESGYTWKKMFRLAFDGVISFSSILVKIPAFIGTALLCATLYLSCFHLISTATSLILGALTLQFFCVWLLAEYISRILDQVKNRPLYIIATTTNTVDSTHAHKTSFERTPHLSDQEHYR